MANENKQSEPIKFKWAKPTEPKPEIYTNYVHTTWTLYDVRFMLGLLIPTEPGFSLEFEVEQQAAITISWAQAKNLRDFLVRLIESYEKTNGEIKPLKLTPAPDPIKLPDNE
jgi:hypothetical protein